MLHAIENGYGVRKEVTMCIEVYAQAAKGCGKNVALKNELLDRRMTDIHWIINRMREDVERLDGVARVYTIVRDKQ